MIDPADARLLQDIAHRESRSILQYMEDVFPWTSSADDPVLAEIQPLIVEDQKCTAGLVRFLHRHRVAPPYLGSYPEPFTTLNFVSLDYLLPLLVEHQQKAVADLERDLGRLKGIESNAEVQKILDVQRRHLAALRGLSAKQPQGVS